MGEAVRRKPNKRCFSWKSPQATGPWTRSRATDTRVSSSSCLNQCKFLWAGAALIGIHVTALYMSMLLEHKITPRNLLDTFPRLYAYLNNFALSVCQIVKCDIPSLPPYFLDPSIKEATSYGTDVCSSMSLYVSQCDKNTHGYAPAYNL